uniref:UBC core domain-containing protein n=1 Tax=Octactis speculum TaxID=3111310 RepID=A0A7S2D863_9STRA|mmetsp:Transcript_44084/g.60223  ORF Transcript_44084/g.60223 Transcript_44084/m.60223 type:complete len:425 (+) Transcript_44084:3-1277(+)
MFPVKNFGHAAASRSKKQKAEDAAALALEIKERENEGMMLMHCLVDSTRDVVESMGGPEEMRRILHHEQSAQEEAAAAAAAAAARKRGPHGGETQQGGGGGALTRRRVSSVSSCSANPRSCQKMGKETGGKSQCSGITLDEDSERAYMEVMRPVQYSDRSSLNGFHYQEELATLEGTQSRHRIRRLAQEHADLSKSLPLNPSSSVWIRAHSDRMDCMQFLISGPEDTPYSGGLMLFDTLFPSDYPNSPPKVNLQTTGQGTVRFNPNLYNCGKVCLSLLGTWGGAEGETWDPQSSTLLQVIISIQSLILVPEPYFNEPGHEREMGQAGGSAASSAYNQKIREATLRWSMLEMVVHPPPGFESVVLDHFHHRRAFHQAQCCQWIDELTEGTAAHGRCTRLVDEFEKALDRALSAMPHDNAVDLEMS